MTLRDLYFFAFGIISATLLYAWIAGHTELTNAVRNNIRSVWARLTRNFGEKEEQPYVDPHAEHVIVKASASGSGGGGQVNVIIRANGIESQSGGNGSNNCPVEFKGTSD